MKRVIPFFAFILLTFAVSAQMLEFNPNPKIMLYENADLSDNYLDLIGKYDVINTTNQELSLRWTRLNPENCPADWDFQICDNNQCYSTSVTTSVGNPAIPEVILEANEIDSTLFSLHVRPRGVPGCCTVQIEYYLDSDPSTVIATANFDVSVNDPNCFVSTSEEVVSALRVFPNPMTDYFQLDGNDENDVRNLVVYNLIGRQVRSFDATAANRFDMSGLPGGIYLVGMVGTEGEILKTVRISRQVARP